MSSVLSICQQTNHSCCSYIAAGWNFLSMRRYRFLELDGCFLFLSLVRFFSIFSIFDPSFTLSLLLLFLVNFIWPSRYFITYLLLLSILFYIFYIFSSVPEFFLLFTPFSSCFDILYFSPLLALFSSSSNFYFFYFSLFLLIKNFLTTFPSHTTFPFLKREYSCITLQLLLSAFDPRWNTDFRINTRSQL